MSEIAAPTDTSRLCLSCGLCCDGTLFSHAKAEPGEVERIASHGLEVVESDGKLRFRLGCRHLSGACCTIYEDRFGICRSFQCKLLQAYAAGELTMEEALSTVDTARQLLAKVAAQDPEAAQLSKRREVAEQVRGWSGIDDPQERKRAARLHLDIVALERFLGSRFRKSKAG